MYTVETIIRIMIERLMNKEEEIPTLTEVYDSMLKCFSYFEDRFNLVDARIDQRFGVVDERLDSLDARLGVIERDTSKIRSTLAEVQEDLATLSVAFDRDAVTLVNHGIRIERLEEVA